jgi:phenylalanyl-tRNA synthetase alpha subunit
MLHKLASQKGPDGRVPPAKYFSIDRVFRNETVDATHLCEFHQVEGVIADYGLTLGGLMEFMDNFFGKMGITEYESPFCTFNLKSHHANKIAVSSSSQRTLFSQLVEERN